MKVKDAYRALTQKFREAGLGTPELDARILIAEVTSLGSAQVMVSEQEVMETQQKKIEDFCSRRLDHEPVARIVGKRGFWSFEAALSPATLEPRPDTETLVEAALEILAKSRSEPLHVADLGTGSGALLIALLLELPNATGLGIDLSEEALTTARQNAALNHVSQRASFAQGDWLAGVDGRFDLIVSNPPYISSKDYDALPESVRRYDPRLALDGGADGLDAYRSIAAQAAAHMKPQGLLILEIGHDQAESVPALFAGQYLLRLQKRDLSGHMRALVFSLR